MLGLYFVRDFSCGCRVPHFGALSSRAIEHSTFCLLRFACKLLCRLIVT